MPAPGINLQQLSSAPAMARMADGSYVPVSMPSRAIHGNHQKLLIVIQYYEGDREAAEEQAVLIADLERVRNNSADIMLFRRHDANEFSAFATQKLRDKFNKVHVEVCRRRDAKGYPFGPNQMWCDLATMIGQSPRWKNDYYAFLPLESDCVPVHPGWIGELIEEFRMAKARNFAATGHINSAPVEHLNGVAVYDANLWGIVGGNKLNGCDPQVAYDIFFRNDILPVACDTPKIMMEYQRPTITAEDLFRPWKNGFEPAMFHGVKDGSARAAVRAKHITFSGSPDISDKTVFTYEHQKPANPSISAKYDIWADGWRSRGWNPIKLALRDASRHEKYSGIMQNLAELAVLGDRTDAMARLSRWIALDLVGGGFMVDPEVMPNQFNPEHLDRSKSGVIGSFEHVGITAAHFDRAFLKRFLDAMGKYPVDNEERLKSAELSILKAGQIMKTLKLPVAVCGQENWRSARIVCFNQFEMQRVGQPGTTLQLMEKFLRET